MLENFGFGIYHLLFILHILSFIIHFNDSPFQFVAETEEMITATEQIPTTNHEGAVVFVPPAKKITATDVATVRTGFSINPKDDIDPVTLRPSTSTTLKSSSTRKVEKSTRITKPPYTTTTTTTTTATTRTRTTRTTTTTVAITKIAQTKETPFVRPTTTTTRRYGSVNEKPGNKSFLQYI